MPNANGGSVATRVLPDAKDGLKVRADRAATHSRRCILSSQSLAHNNTSVLGGDTRISRGCISADGTDARKRTEL